MKKRIDYKIISEIQSEIIKNERDDFELKIYKNFETFTDKNDEN